MKKAIVLLLSVALVIGMAAIASAIPIEFDIADAPFSSVTLTNEVNIGADLSVALADLGSIANFSLIDGESATFDFFEISIESGFIGYASADITATLAFVSPSGYNVTGTGSGWGLTFLGHISGGILDWNNMPQTFAYGLDHFDVNFEDIHEWGLGNSTTVSATITAHAGSSSTPVPEPSTMLLLGTGLLGLVTYGRKRYNKRGNK